VTPDAVALLIEHESYEHVGRLQESLHFFYV